MPHFFRLRFRLRPGVVFDSSDAAHRFAVAGVDLTLRGAEYAPIRDSPTLALESDALYSSETEARRCGLVIKGAVDWAGARLNVGIDSGPIVFQLQSGTPDRVLDPDGLTVHQMPASGNRPTLLTLAPDADRSVAVADFTAAVDEAVAHVTGQGSWLPDKVQLAVELFNLHFFEASERARFLLLVTILEVLATHTKRPPAVQDLIGELTAVVERDPAALADPDEVKGLKSALGALKRISTKEAIRRLVDAAPWPHGVTVQTMSPGDFAAECYGKRSRLIHGGTEPARMVVWRRDLSEVVRCVLWDRAGISPNPALPLGKGLPPQR